MAKSMKKPSQRRAGAEVKHLKVAGSWQLQTAKARFNEVFRMARTQGPQRITRQGKKGVVMIADEEYEKLVGKSHQPKDLWEFFRQSPLVGLGLKFERNKDVSRDIEL